MVNLGEVYRNIPTECVLGLPRDPLATTFALHGNSTTQGTQEQGCEEESCKEEDG
jgi:hypothetical protein